MSFPETDWTRVADATLHGDAQGRAALESLCHQYYRPVRSYIEWHCPDGINGREPADLAQGFFLHLMEGRLWQRARPQRGKFRNFLLTVADRWLKDQRALAAAAKRGGGVQFAPLDTVSDETEPPAAEEVGSFDREWAVAVMHAAMDRLAHEAESERSAEHWGVIKQFLGGQPAAPAYETAAEVLEMSVGALSTEIHRWRRRLGGAVRAELARTVTEPHEIEEEIAYLRQLLVHHG